MKYEISLSIGAFQRKLGDFAALAAAKAAGADIVDFNLEIYSPNKEGCIYSSGNIDVVAEHFCAVKKYADEMGIRIGQTHGRIKGYKTDEAHNANELLGMKYDALATSILGSNYCVVHSVHLGLDAAAEDQRAYNTRMWHDYISIAKEYGIVLATETFGDTHTPDGRCGIDFFGDVTEFITAYEAIREENGNAPYICTCVDTGHTNKALRFGNGPTADEMIRRLGSSVGCLHLNDNNGMEDEHLVPMAGNINWQAVLEALSDIGYNGTYNMELNLRRFGTSVAIMKEYAAFSVKVMKNMLDDFYL